MTPGEAIQAEKAIEDGWPYPDDDSDQRGDLNDDLSDADPYEGLDYSPGDFDEDEVDPLEESFRDFGFGADGDRG